MIRGSVRRQADFDIKDVSPLAHAEHCFIPALFVAAVSLLFFNLYLNQLKPLKTAVFFFVS